MGCSPSKYHKIYSKNNVIRALKPNFDALLLSEDDVGRLYRVFKRVDMDNSGTIDTAELLTVMDVERTKFTTRVFSIFDEDKSGAVDFKELVLALWNYCSLGKASLVMFAFDIYDRDNGGSISMEEVKKMLRDVYGKSFDNNTQAKL